MHACYGSTACTSDCSSALTRFTTEQLIVVAAELVVAEAEPVAAVAPFAPVTSFATNYRHFTPVELTATLDIAIVALIVITVITKFVRSPFVFFVFSLSIVSLSFLLKDLIFKINKLILK